MERIWDPFNTKGPREICIFGVWNNFPHSYKYQTCKGYLNGTLKQQSRAFSMSYIFNTNSFWKWIGILKFGRMCSKFLVQIHTYNFLPNYIKILSKGMHFSQSDANIDIDCLKGHKYIPNYVHLLSKVVHRLRYPKRQKVSIDFQPLWCKHRHRYIRIHRHKLSGRGLYVHRKLNVLSIISDKVGHHVNVFSIKWELVVILW